jgi:hypothetical protein
MGDKWATRDKREEFYIHVRDVSGRGCEWVKGVGSSLLMSVIPVLGNISILAV